MKEIVKGVFQDDGVEFPCRPKDINVGKYFLPNTLETREQEEAAARILSLSQQANCWVGVSCERLFCEMQKQIKERNCRRRHRRTSGPEFVQSGVWIFGIKYVITGVEQLLAKKLLRGVDLKTENPIFFPTPQLVQAIMQKQGVAVA